MCVREAKYLTGVLTVTLSGSPRAAQFVRLDKRDALPFDQTVGCRDLSEPFGSEVFNAPASRLRPSRPAITHEALQSPQTRRSFPSFIQPHLAAATASRAGGLFVYVESLNVSMRERNDESDEGL